MRKYFILRFVFEREKIVFNSHERIVFIRIKFNTVIFSRFIYIWKQIVFISSDFQ